MTNTGGVCYVILGVPQCMLLYFKEVGRFQMSGKVVVRRAGPAQSSSGLVELPLEILEMVAQMLPDAFSLAQMHQGSTGLHSACSRRVASSSCSRRYVTSIAATGSSPRPRGASPSLDSSGSMMTTFR